MDEVFANTPGVETWVTISGFSMMEGAALPNAVTAFVIFESWAKRGTKLNQYAIMDELYRDSAKSPKGNSWSSRHRPSWASAMPGAST